MRAAARVKLSIREPVTRSCSAATRNMDLSESRLAAHSRTSSCVQTRALRFRSLQPQFQSSALA
eukprot:307218-Rhodomonas_salina.1